MCGSVIGAYVPGDEERGIPESIRRGSSRSGFIYKNQEAFYSDPFAVCYIPELSDSAYTGLDFLKMSLGQPEIAEEMFLSVDWQHPETWLDEQFRTGELDVCERCGKIYQSYDEAECPFCRDKERRKNDTYRRRFYRRNNRKKNRSDFKKRPESRR